MSRATSPRPIVASTKVSQMRAPPSGSAKPSVNSDDPLTSKEWVTEPVLIPQKMIEKPTVTVSIHTNGRLTRAIGA